MCVLRTNIVTNCKKCKSLNRIHCRLKKKTATKTFMDNRSSEKRE